MKTAHPVANIARVAKNIVTLRQSSGGSRSQSSRIFRSFFVLIIQFLARNSNFHNSLELSRLSRIIFRKKLGPGGIRPSESFMVWEAFRPTILRDEPAPSGLPSGPLPSAGLQIQAFPKKRRRAKSRGGR